MNHIFGHPFFLNLNKKGLIFLKKILIIFKINLFIITLFTSSAQATTSFVDTFSVASKETGPTGLTFNNDGTKMYVVGYIGDAVHEYSLSTGFDISKNINGFDMKFNANQSLSENSDQAAEISLSRQF